MNAEQKLILRYDAAVAKLVAKEPGTKAITRYSDGTPAVAEYKDGWVQIGQQSMRLTTFFDLVNEVERLAG